MPAAVHSPASRPTRVLTPMHENARKCTVLADSLTQLNTVAAPQNALENSLITRDSPAETRAKPSLVSTKSPSDFHLNAWKGKTYGALDFKPRAQQLFCSQHPLRLVCLAALALLFAVSTRADPIDDYLSAEIAAKHIPGLSLAVIRDSKVEKLSAYGLANVELAVPASPQTVFQIQSITKTFTSAAILMLMEEGKLSLDDPIGKHLEGTPDTWKTITLRHLLSHTSGIKDFINEPTASLRLDVSETDVLRATAPRPLNFEPGEKYAYSNTNYHLLAMVIRKITGKSFGDYLNERIFTPLGMTNTRIVSLSDIIPNRAAGYYWENGRLHNGNYIAQSILGYGGGGIVSTAEDMAKWAIALDGEKLLKKATLQAAWTPMKLNDGSNSVYGLGWGTGAVNGHRTVGHSGAHATGFTSAIIRFRDDNLSIIVLTNSRSADPSAIAKHIAGMCNPALKPAPPPKDTEKK